MSQGFNVGTVSVGASAQPPGSIPGHSGTMAVASDSHPSAGLGSMGLPASPRSFSSGSLTSLVGHQVGSPQLSQLEQQENQLHRHLPQTHSGTPPSQLLEQQQQEQQQQEPQSVQQQDHSPESSQQQVVVQLLGNSSEFLGIMGQQGLGAGAQQVKLEEQLLVPKREIKSEDVIAHQVVQHSIQRPDILGLSSQFQQQDSQHQMQRQQHPQQMHAQLNLLQQQHLLQQQQQLLQSHHLQRSPLQLQQLQHEIQLQQHGSNLQIAAQAKQPAFEPGVCSRRLMQYLYHQRHQDRDNNIVFWRKFVTEYFAPHAKKRWCVSLYGSGGQQPTGVFPQDVWQCEICGTKPGRGFETTVEVLPRLCKIKFDSGISEELLFVDFPNEYCLSSGQLVLEYGKATQESVFEQLHVVRNGQLRIIFSADLKIMSWEFCAWSHEEVLPRRLILSQVTALAAIAQKYQTSVTQNGGGLSLQEMQMNCALFVKSAHQLARNLEVPTVNDLGYTKRYVRCLQISEVVNSMKDLIGFSQENNIGPIDSLYSFPRQSLQAAGDFLGNQACQQCEKQHEQLELQSLIADSGLNNSLSSIQQQLSSESGHMGLSSPIHQGVFNPLTSFLHQSSLTSLQNPLQFSLQNETNFSNSRGGGLHPLQHQQQSSGVPGSFLGGRQNSPTNSLSSIQNSLASFSGGGLGGSLSNQNVLSSMLQQSSAGAVGGPSLVEQQQQQLSLQSGHRSQHENQDTQNVVHHLLQDTTTNQQMNRGNLFAEAVGLSGVDANHGVNAGLSGSMNSFTGARGTNGTGTANLGLASNGVISNQLGLNKSNLGALAGTLSNSIGGAGGNSVLGNHSLRSMESGLSSLGRNTGAMSALNGRLNLAAVGQQQNVQMQDPSQQPHHHDFGGTGLLGDGLNTASGFGGIQFNWTSSP